MTAQALPADRQDDDYWNSLLDGDPIELIVGIAETGYYRMRMREGGDQPIMISRGADGQKRYKIGKGPTYLIEDEAIFCEKTFSWCAEKAIEFEAYEEWMQSGRWPDDAPPPVRLSNLPEDPFEELKMLLEAEAEELERALKREPIKSETDATRYGNWLVRFEEMSKQLDKMRVDQKKAHDDASKAVQARFKPILEVGASAKKRILDVIKDWRKANKGPVQAANPKAPDEEQSGQRKPISGVRTNGRTIVVRTKWVAKIVDWDAATEAVKGDVQVKIAIQAACDRAARGDRKPIPGVEFVEE